MENFHGWRPFPRPGGPASPRSMARGTVIAAVDAHYSHVSNTMWGAEGAGSAKKVGWRDTGRVCKRHSRYRRGGNNYSKVWIRGAYLRDITRQIAISRADLHRTCRDVASPQRNVYIYTTCVCVCARANVFEESRNIVETFLIMIRRLFQTLSID